MKVNHIYKGDSLSILKKLPSNSVHCIVTSPPYYNLRDYGIKGQIGHEQTPEQFIENLVQVFRECKRVLRKDGTLWLNMGDTYAGSGKAGKNPKNHKMFGKTGWDKSVLIKSQQIPKVYKRKDLMAIPWRLALALQTDGWYLRQDIIWAKGISGIRREGTVMPEPVTDRCTKAHEYIFLLSKSPRYYFDIEAIKEATTYKGKQSRNFRKGITDPFLRQSGFKKSHYQKGNRRSVWRVNPSRFKGKHFATYPEGLIEPCILAGSPQNGIVLDPFMGAGTTAIVAVKNKRKYIGAELNPEYIAIAKKRIKSVA